MTYKPLKADSGGIGSKVTLRQASVHDTTSGATPIIDELNVWEFLIGTRLRLLHTVSRKVA